MSGLSANSVACIGTGNVGSSWAQLFARAGFQVRVWDARPEQAKACAQTVAQLYGAESIQQCDDLADALADACHVQESIAEQAVAKRELFATIDPLLGPDTILASSTSAIPASQLFAEIKCRARCIIAHPVNPPHLIPLVELSAAPFTADETVARTRALMEAAGQKPIEIRGEIEGFALNRLQWALLAEALHLVEAGHCTPEEVDLVLTHGLARRWVEHGPFANGHLNSSGGAEGYFTDLRQAMTSVWSSLAPPSEPSVELVQHIHEAMSRTMRVADIKEHQTARKAALDRLNRYLDGSAAEDEIEG